MTATYRTLNEDQTSLIQKALVASVILHSLLVFLEFHKNLPEVPKREDAITVTFTDLKPLPIPVVPKQKVVNRIEVKESEKPVPTQKKIVAGTQKVVADSKALGDPNAKVVQKVQKGDPASKNFTKYKPGTDFQKLKATNIGTGGKPSDIKTLSPGGGSGDTYKAGDFAFKSLNSNAMGKRFTINKVDDGGAGTGSTGGVGAGAGRGFGDGTVTGTVGGTLKKADILTNVGSLTGATVGVIGTSKGAHGLSTKGTIALAGTPDDTQILGSMDRDLVRRILLDHLAQFRYCYQSELDKSADDSLQGVVNMDFVINASGRVGNANVHSATNMTSQIKGCLSGVLRGIEFPQPKGGGIVQVKQPMNFYPKNQ